MHGGGPHGRLIAPRRKNISRTTRAANRENSAESGDGCVFIEAYTWPAGFPPFCGRPVLLGSAYCPMHAVRCAMPDEEATR
jgi:hypothetical protein